MKFKVWDKVRCISQTEYFTESYFTIWNIYTITRLNEWAERDIRLIWNDYTQRNVVSRDFELVQEDKLPHELLWLPKYFVVKKDESDPFWELFCNWVSNNFSDSSDRRRWEYVWYDWNKINKWWIRAVNYNEWDNKYNEWTLITLAERDICVNKKAIQTKKPIRSCEHNWSIYKEDTIDWVSIEDMKATRDNINSKLLTHRNLFNKKK